ncbi:MAG TPA: hypothetical protein VJ952_03155, partial [Opitutales bacterium]|nr:hypothetical protein [Opitutales bacterium]
VDTDKNDGRKPIGYLPEVKLPFENAVLALSDRDTGELIYCYRVEGNTFRAPVYTPARYILKAGKNRPDKVLLQTDD